MSVRNRIRRPIAGFAAIVLLAGCAMGPTREDPFEPRNRVPYKGNEADDGNPVKQVAQAAGYSTAAIVPPAGTKF